MAIDRQSILDIWARLGEEGKAPGELIYAAEVLPLYTVAIDPWIERLVKVYLQGLSQRSAHFKLVIAPYGGGKTHFLMALGSRALKEGFAVSYIACAEGVSFENPMDVYRVFMKNLQLPGEEKPGTRSLLRAVINYKYDQIRIRGVPDPEAALGMWLKALSQEDYPELALGRVMSEALRAQLFPDPTVAGEPALRWLRGEIDTLTKEERESLRLARVAKKDQNELGRNLLLSIIRFLKEEAGAKGVVLLFDEVETLFSAKGKALQRLLAAIRVMLDQPASVKEGVPLLGLFAAVPDIIDLLSKYPAVEQRLAVGGASFEEGNDFSPQIHLDKVASQEKLLQDLGFKLLELGELSRAHRFDRNIQKQNIETLAKVASQSSLEIDARRLFVKACVNILDLQYHQGERRFLEEELRDRYRGFFENLKQKDEQELEP
ncbi:MAG: DUF2791 family P-loop domain-containing protein [Candidatus Hadarchaeum sp.]